MAKAEETIAAHQKFWRGDGPCLILVPTGVMAQYDTEGCPRRFENPELMCGAEMHRALGQLD